MSKEQFILSRLQKIGWARKFDLYKSKIDEIEVWRETKQPAVSIVIIANLFRDDFLKNLRKLEQQRDENFELIFVNNGAPKQHFESAFQYIDWYIGLSHNTGAYMARNIGTIFAEAPILLFIDDDGVPADNFVNAHKNLFSKYDIIAARGACFPKTENPMNNLQKHYFLGPNPCPYRADLEGNSAYLTTYFFSVGGWDDDIEFGGGGFDLAARLLRIEPDIRKQIYSPEPILFHDYAIDERHLKIKKERGKKSLQRLRIIHPYYDELIAKWKALKGNNRKLIYRANWQKIPLGQGVSHLKKHKIQHLVLTRFNIRNFFSEKDKNNHSVMGKEWMENRFKLFEKYTIPAIENQTNKYFKWLVLFDVSTAPEDRKRINLYCQKIKNFIPVFTTAKKMSADIAEHIEQEAKYLLTTRIDNDDALHKDAIEYIQSAIIPARLQFLNFYDGYQLKDGKLFLSNNTNSAFISLISEKMNNCFMDVFAMGNHSYFHKMTFIHQIVGKPLWLQVIHDTNLVNDKIKGEIKPLESLQDGFDYLKLQNDVSIQELIELLSKTKQNHCLLEIITTRKHEGIEHPNKILATIKETKDFQTQFFDTILVDAESCTHETMKTLINCLEDNGVLIVQNSFQKWKDIMHVRALHNDLDVLTLDEKNGITIIQKKQSASYFSFPVEKIQNLTFSDFEMNKEKWMNILSLELFKEWTTSIHTKNIIPKMRWEIIQELLDNSEHKNYLEIGVAQGKNFVEMKAKFKVGIDPIPPGTYTRTALHEENLNYYAMTSDAFFEQYANGLNKQFDVVLIDGLHTYEQALKDVENTLPYLHKNGVIVLHDCNPISEARAVHASAVKEAKQVALAHDLHWDGGWNGDVWKSVVHLRATRKDIHLFVLNTDQGLGFVTKKTQSKLFDFDVSSLKNAPYKMLEENREDLINLKPMTFYRAWKEQHYRAKKEKISLLYMSFLPSRFAQIMEKIHHQVIGLQYAGIEAKAILIGKDDNNIDWEKYPEIAYIHFDNQKRDRLDKIKILDGLIARKNPDFVYFRVQGKEMASQEFVNLVKKHGSIILESQTKKENELFVQNAKEHLALEQQYGREVLRASRALVAVSEDVRQYDLQRARFEIKDSIALGNGYDVASVPLKNFMEFDGLRMNILYLGSVTLWHGLDRVLMGLAQYPNKENVKLFIVGEGKLLNDVKIAVQKLRLQNSVVFTGWKSGKALDEICNMCHIGISSLALHRLDIREITVLKTRHYIARGLPTVIGYDDYDLHDDLPFVFNIPADDSPVNFDDLFHFVDKMNHFEVREQMRQFATQYLDWKPKMKRLAGFISALKDQKNEEVNPFLEDKKVDSMAKLKVKIKDETASRKRILFVCHNFPPYRYGGAQLYALNLAKQMKEEKLADVEILYPVFREEFKGFYIAQKQFEGVQVYELHKEFTRGFENAVRHPAVGELIEQFLDKKQYDAIHFHGFGQITPIPIEIAKKRNIPMVMTLHEHWFLCFYWFLMTPDQKRCTGPESVEKCTQCFLKYYTYAKKELMTYDNVKRFMQQRFTYFKEMFDAVPIKVAPSKYLVSVFEQYGFQNVLVQNLGMVPIQPVPKVKKSQRLIVGFIGQVSRRKGVNFLINAIRSLPSDLVELHIYGKSHEKGFMMGVQKGIESIENIHYFGAYKPEELSRIMSSFDILAVPSLWENYPLVVQEAFQNKVPVIASNTGGFPEAIENGKNGLLFEAGNDQDIAEKIAYFIQNPDKITAFKQAIKPIRTMQEDADFYIEKYGSFEKKEETDSYITFKQSANIQQKIQDLSEPQKGIQSKNEIENNVLKRSKFKVQFYVFKNVHWPMFENLFQYLNNRSDVEKIIICLPYLPNIIQMNHFSTFEKIRKTGAILTAKPHKDVDVTFIADAIAGKVKGYGKIVNLGHGTISKGYYFTKSVWTERENAVDLLCVPGRYAKEKLTPILNTKVVATGMPKMDLVFQKALNRKTLCKLLNLDTEKKIVLYAPTFNKDLSSAFDFVESFARLKSNDFYVLIKLHGSTLPVLQQKYFAIAEHVKNIFYIEDANLAPYIAGADLMISDVSSAFMEFMALDKPVILYDNPQRKNYHGYDPENIEYKWRDLATCVDSFDNLLQVLPNILVYGDNKSSVRRKYANQLFADLQGRASENVWFETRAILSEKSKVNIPTISLFVSLEASEFFALRSFIETIEMYSVMPIELILNIVDMNEKLQDYLEQLKSFNQFTNILIFEDEKFENLVEKASGELCLVADLNIVFYRNFDYILFLTFNNNEKVNALTGLTLGAKGSLNAELRYPLEEDVPLSRYAYDFINEYQGKEIALFQDSVLDFLAFRKSCYEVSDALTYADFAQNLVKKQALYHAVSIFYGKIPESDYKTMKTFWEKEDEIPNAERLKTALDVIQSYFYSDFAEILLDGSIAMKKSLEEVLQWISYSVVQRFYDIKLKQKIIDFLPKDFPLRRQFEKEIEAIEMFNKPKIKKVENKSRKRVMIYFFKNVHIPILKPIYEELLTRDVEIAFAVMPYAPQIRAGFLPEELEIIKNLDVPIYDQPQDFKPDVTVIADSVYPWVKNCGKLIHVGHGVLSKGQYYCNSDLARREEQADVVCVPGMFHKQALKNVISTPVFATGMAKLDTLYRNETTKESVLHYYHLPQDKKYILYAPTFNDELSSLSELAGKINQILPDKNTYLIVKLHGSTAEEYRSIFKQMTEVDSRVIYADRDEADITPFLAVADLLISDVSSVMMEFASLDKPVILYNNPKWEDYTNYNPNNIDFKWRDIGIQVRNLTQLKIAVLRSLHNPKDFSKKRNFYTDQLFANKYDGRGAGRICDVIEQLL